MTSIPVKYGAAELLKVTVSFAYDRYIMEKTASNKKITGSKDTSNISREFFGYSKD